jgi:pyruvate/2-oxoglutarate dehydrogenase complex dihydrolipoamide dehydrogenase (E3) component
VINHWDTSLIWFNVHENKQCSRINCSDRRKMKDIVIAGFGAAGFAALSTLRRLGCRDRIVVIDPKPYDLLHPCGLPYALEGKADKTLLTQMIGLDRMCSEHIYGKCTGINKNHSIEVETENGRISIRYDNLLLTTGSSPLIPEIGNIRNFMGNGVFTLVNASDLDAIVSWCAGKKTAVVIGAGAIGLESAVALSSMGMSVTIIEAREQILPGVLDPDMAVLVEESVTRNKIVIKTLHTAEYVDGNGKMGIIHASGTDFPYDICILAVGSVPNIAAALECGIICEKQGIVVDDMLRSSERDILAAGDCAATRSLIDGKIIPAKLATSSYRQGVVAAHVIAGHEKKYMGSAGTFVSVIGDCEVAGTGFTSDAAKTRGFDPVIAKISARVYPEYMKNDAEITIKLIADKKSGKVLGAQSVGREGAAPRINIVSAAIEWGATIDQIERIELAYCPAVSEVQDPLLRAVDGIRRRIRG